MSEACWLFFLALVSKLIYSFDNPRMTKRGQIISPKFIFCVLENQKVRGEMEQHQKCFFCGQRPPYFGMVKCPPLFNSSSPFQQP